MLNVTTTFLLLVGLCLGMAIDAVADETPDTEREITALIEFVEKSQCAFHRNGKMYTSEQAASHLRLKWSKGERYAKSAEAFIDNLASKSSWTGKPYSIECKPEAKRDINSWLKAELVNLR